MVSFVLMAAKVGPYCEGILTVADPNDRSAAMAAWKEAWAGYSPSIHPDDDDARKAHWSRFDTCE